MGAVNDVQLSLLLDTRAAVTLLREDVWARIAAKKSQELKPRSTLKLVSAGGVPLTIHGCARVELELEEEKFATEIVVVSPLTTEAILGLDFLSQQGASIDLVDKKLHLAECSLSLREPESATVGTKRVRAEKTTEIPPCSMMEVIGCLDEPVEPGTAWLLEETTEKRAPTAVARALVQPMNTRVPVRLLNPRAEPLMVDAVMELATLEEAETPVESVNAVSSGDPPAVGEEKREMLWRLAEQSGPELSGEEREMFFHLHMQMCSRYPRPTWGARTSCSTPFTQEMPLRPGNPSVVSPRTEETRSVRSSTRCWRRKWWSHRRALGPPR